MLSLDTIGLFTWSFHHRFHIETHEGNFEWSDPQYPGGNNTIRPCESYEIWRDSLNIPYGREKGVHTIRDYCGPDVIFLSN